MNPQYKIHGNKRRQLKKVLNGLKIQLQGLMIEHDVNQIYGVNYPEDYLKQVNRLKSDINYLEVRLKEKYEPTIQY